MSKLLLKFAVRLTDANDSSFFEPHGPLFHRWLPNGEADAINLKSHPGSTVKVWFDRRGFADKGRGIGFIEYDETRREVDPAIMHRQCKLDAGPLSGIAEVEVTSNEFNAVAGNKKGDTIYLALGKRITSEIIVPPLSQFVKTLRTHFGQYWLSEIIPWDSRNISLGGYCASTLNLRWSSDSGKTWQDFRPDESVYRATCHSGGNFDQYLTKDDWERLRQLAPNGLEPSLASITLGTAHGHLDERNFKFALIDGVLALELAIDDFIGRRLQGSGILEKSIASLKELPLRTQVVALAQTVPNSVSIADLEATVKAIDYRNKVVHDAWDPAANISGDILALFKTVCSLIDGPGFKFPACNSGNALLSDS